MKTLFILLISGTMGFAQTIKIAPVVGPNVTFSNFSKAARDYFSSNYYDVIDADVKTSFPPVLRFQLGGLVDYSVSDKFSLQSGLLVTLRGLTQNTKGSFETGSGIETFKGKGKMRVSYLEIPVWAGFKLGESGFKVVAGPSFGFVLGGKTHTSITFAGDTDSESEGLKVGNDSDEHDIRPIDISFNIGLSKEISIADKPFEISVYAQPSISKWNPQTGADPDFYIRHFSSGIRLAYYFTLKE